MSTAEVWSEEEEDGDTSVRGDDVDEDKEGSDAISSVVHDCFVSNERLLFVIICQLSIVVKFLELCKHASCTPVTSSVSTNFMNNILCSCCCYWEHQN